ncbi:MAG: Transcriptional regulatory protein WalR [Myxococcota bacterium]|nr:Transcriptional regulatory protein WalR [Myxococcota bacterium]
MKPRILLVEDEAALARGIRMNLDDEGYEVSIAGDGREALSMASREAFDLIILDVMLPEKDGVAVCRELRAKGARMPILFLTALNDVQDRVAGIKAGGDDYLAKPFAMEELSARIAAQLRRVNWGAAPKTGGGELVRAGAALVDFAAFRLTRGGETRDLGVKEAGLLRLLMAHPGKTLPRELILAQVWGDDIHVVPRTVDNFISALRRSIEPDPAAPRHIISVRGVGYRWED